MQDLFIKKLSFKKRPIPIPPDYRPSYKLAQVVLVLKLCCRGSSSGLLKLHLLSWALKSNKNKNILSSLIQSDFQTDFAVWGIEPTLNRALQLAVADGICSYAKGKYTLAQKGEEFFKAIDNEKDLFDNEKQFLNSIGKNKLTDSQLKRLSTKWKL